MHRIEENDKQQGRTMAWHGLTEIVGDLSLDNNWLKTWDITARALFTEGLNETPFKILGATDNPSITIGKPFADSYRPVTNAEFLQLMKDSTDGIQGVQLESIGSVRNRGRVFASFSTEKLGEYRAGGRDFKQFINFGNGHDQSSVLWANTSNIATVCDNTFSMNLHSVEEAIGDATRQRHTKHVMARLPEMGALIRNAVILQQDFALAFENLATMKISTKHAEQVFAGFVVINGEKQLSTRAKNIIAKLTDLFRRGKGNKGQNLADLFSAVTDYYTHSNAGNGRRAWKQFESSEFGSGATAKQEFWKIVNDQEKLLKLREKGMARLKLK
jgi:hypothetical protein